MAIATTCGRTRHARIPGRSLLATGPGRLDDKGVRVKPEVKNGDVVLYAKYAGTEVKIDGEELLILKESDVLAIVK